ncbi:MAG: hypothetical protein NE328_19490 [Lentisphaeraceae bacterium]|nr:hypothetical protein [Lentisphaeraceae bacterium]
MPKATLSYLYELKISEVIQSLANNLIEDFDPDKANTYILQLNQNSDDFECILFNHDDQYFDIVDDLESKGASYFFFDHFDPHCYAYFKWNNISQKKMEELLGETLQESDFIHMKTKDKGKYRECGSVMLG